MKYSHICIFLSSARSKANDSIKFTAIFSCRAAEVSSVPPWSCTSQFKHCTTQRSTHTRIGVHSPVSNKYKYNQKSLICIMNVLVVAFCPLKIALHDLQISHKSNPEHHHFKPSRRFFLGSTHRVKLGFTTAPSLHHTYVTCPLLKAPSHWLKQTARSYTSGYQRSHTPAVGYKEAQAAGERSPRWSVETVVPGGKAKLQKYPVKWCFWEGCEGIQCSCLCKVAFPKH